MFNKKRLEFCNQNDYTQTFLGTISNTPLAKAHPESFIFDQITRSFHLYKSAKLEESEFCIKAILGPEYIHGTLAKITEFDFLQIL